MNNVNANVCNFKLCKLSILHLNINRLRNKLLSLEAFIDLDIDSKPHVIMLTETWLEPDEHVSIYLPGYVVATQSSRACSRGGGTIILVQNDIADRYKVVNVEHFLREKVFELSSVCLEISPSSKICFTVLYRCPSSNVKDFIDILENYINSLKSRNIVIAGDFNINFGNPEDINTKGLLQLLLEYNIRPTILGSTRITEKTSTTVDNILTNVEQYTEAQVIPCSFSDHDAQFINLNIVSHSNSSQTKTTKKRLYSSTSIQAFQKDLKNINWDLQFLNKNCNEKLEIFYSVFNLLAAKHFPLKKVVCKQNPKKWITRGIKKSSRTKRRLLILSRDKNSNVPQSYFRRYKRTFKKVLVTARKIHVKKIISKANNKSKAIWNLVRENTGKYKKK